MDFHDFPRCLGKSGKLREGHPNFRASPAQSNIRTSRPMATPTLDRGHSARRRRYARRKPWFAAVSDFEFRVHGTDQKTLWPRAEARRRKMAACASDTSAQVIAAHHGPVLKPCTRVGSSLASFLLRTLTSSGPAPVPGRADGSGAPPPGHAAAPGTGDLLPLAHAAGVQRAAGPRDLRRRRGPLENAKGRNVFWN